MKIEYNVELGTAYFYVVVPGRVTPIAKRHVNDFNGDVEVQLWAKEEFNNRKVA